jgi:4a-hydroxytetrahydrobiopterin dehydratase
MGGKPKLTERELAAGLAGLPEWTLEDGKWIVRKMTFPSFPEAVAYVQKVADYAESVNHHPLITIDYRKVTLRLTTWHSGGLTELDLQSAQAYERLYAGGTA